MRAFQSLGTDEMLSIEESRAQDQIFEMPQHLKLSGTV